MGIFLCRRMEHGRYRIETFSAHNQKSSPRNEFDSKPYFVLLVRFRMTKCLASPWEPCDDFEAKTDGTRAKNEAATDIKRSCAHKTAS